MHYQRPLMGPLFYLPLAFWSLGQRPEL